MGVTITTADNTDTLTLTSTDDDALAAPNLRLYRNSANPVDDDVIGRVDFEGRNDNSQDVIYANIQCEIMQEADGSEDGQLQFGVMKAGTLRNAFTIDRVSIVFNEDSQDIDTRFETDSNTHGLFVDAGNNAVLVNKSSPTQNYYHLSGTIVPGFEMFGTANAAGRSSAFTYGSADVGGHLMTFGKSRSATPDNYTIVQDEDQLGRISFQGTDGTHFIAAAQIHVTVDGTPNANVMPGRLSFHTNNSGTGVSERMRINANGTIGLHHAGTTVNQVTIENQNASGGRNGLKVTNPSSVSAMNGIESTCVRSASSAYSFFLCRSNSSSPDTEFQLRGDGNAFADGSFSGGGADYAEYFEWKDGNSSDEDRVGYSVVLDNNKIVKATDSDDASKIIGVISANPAVVGDGDIERWKSKYLKDDYGRYVWEEYTSTEWVEIKEDGDNKNHSYATDEIPSDLNVPSDAKVITKDKDNNLLTRRKINPSYDSTKEYVSRENRKEWDTVGLMGKLRLRKGEPTGTNWIKMRDISDSVEEWLVR